MNFFESQEWKQFDLDHSFSDRGMTDAGFHAHRERPHLGQPWTFHGERGKEEVRGVTMRDIADSIARGLAQSLAPEDTYDFDPGALAQSALVNIEKIMGIYPNTE